MFVTASDETRRSGSPTPTGSTRRRPTKRLTESDKARADYLQRFYGVRRELPTHYDLVLSTDRLTPGVAAAVVAARSRPSR